MADSEKYFTKTVDGQLSVATVAQNGEIIPEESRPGDKYTTALVQTDDGPQLCVKTFDLNGGGGGGGDVPDNVYTQDNLVAGTNISITEVPRPIIDDNTVELYHCNGDMIDTIANHEWTTSANQNKYSYPEGKFAQGVRKTQAYDDAGNPLNSFDANIPATIDFWICRIDTSVYMGFKTVGGGDWNFYGTYVRANNTNINYPSGITLGVNEWHHIAIVNDGLGQSTSEKYYIDGKLAGSKANNGSFGLNAIGQGGIVDEIRISNVARWTADFTPFSQPYQEASGDPVYQINNTQDLSSYLQNTATGSNSLTILGNPSTKLNTVNVGIESDAFSYSSVAIGHKALAGENSISIGSQSSAGMNSHRGCIAIGGSASYGNYSVAIGGNSFNGKNVVIGNKASANEESGIAIGYQSVVGKTGVTGVGENSIQIGTGTNLEQNTMCIGFGGTNYKLLDGNTGLIPPERLGTGYDATKTQVLKHVNGVLTWVDEA